MAIPNGLNPTLYGVKMVAQKLTANNANSILNSIEAGRTSAYVSGVTNDADDWVVLPSLSAVEIGHTIRIYAGASSNFELRTPASSNEKINDVDSDGTQEYLVTDTDTVIVTKISSTAWIAQSITKLGAVRTAVVPD